MNYDDLLGSTPGGSSDGFGIPVATSLLTTLESLSDGFWQLDPQWRIVYVNGAACRVVGQSRDELVGRILWQAFPAIVGTRVETAYHQAVADRVTVEFEHYYEPLARWFGIKASPTPGGGLAIVSRDITEGKRSEAVLRAAHDTFRHLVENSPFGVYVVDSDFRLVQVSVGARQTFETVHPLIGRDFAEVLRLLWPEPFATEAIGRFRHTLETGETYHAPGTVERRHDIGEVQSYDWKIERLLLPDGRPGVVCHFYDLSERQRLEAELSESERRFRLASDAAGAMVYDVDLTGRRHIICHGLKRVTGYQTDEVGPTLDWWYSIIHPDDVASHRTRVMALVEAGHPYTAVYRIRHKDGRWIWVEATTHVVKNDANAATHVIGTLLDITQRRHYEEVLHDAERRKDEFLAMLAHELRNPLAPLATSLEVIKRARGNANLQSRALATMERQVGHMVRLVDDLMDVSRIKTGKLEARMQRLDLASVVEHAVEACQPLVERYRHTLRVMLPDAPVHLRADPVRLAQVFCNLITNSCKYSDPGGRIHVSAERDGATVRVSVTDTGCGIPGNRLPQVFDLFMQDGRTREMSGGGLGIGLPLVKRLVEMHGGTVTAQSEGIGLGSTFTVCLPAFDDPP